ncbi:MAG: hypothetical protein MJY89_00505 [Bacteroidales bacterium]|nr:hypothetical protein [Bacteroidales bacterium]
MKCNSRSVPVVFALSAVAVCISCGPAHKLAGLSDAGVSAMLRLPADKPLPQLDTVGNTSVGDTLHVVGLDGKEVLIMKAIRDEETGDMVATEELRAAVVSARFRNVAERNGRIDLEFQVNVPAGMQDSRWQLRLHPELFALGDSLRLEDLVITGEGFRRMQMRGYEQYGRFESRIQKDSSRFIDRRALEIFLERNSEMKYIGPVQAEDHYTNHLAININEFRKQRLADMWKRYVKVPLVTEGIRLDTIVVKPDGDFEYNYVQTVNTRPNLRKIDVRMGGEIFDGPKCIYTMPDSDPLSFYVSSLSSFADMTDRYKTMVISRTVSANTTAVIDFEKGSSVLDETLGDNGKEMSRVRKILEDLIFSDEFEMDSIVISAFASPEGTLARNNALTYSRAKSASDYFRRYVSHLKDSLRREEGFFLDLGAGIPDGGMKRSEKASGKINFISRSGSENWMQLGELVGDDSILGPEDKNRYFAIAGTKDPDARENLLSKEPFYKDISARMYPRLRTVRFDFHLHRTGMVKDTVHTNVLDTAYMAGVRALSDHDYDTALNLLSPYQDYNTAVAMVALDRNRSALPILDACAKTARVNYMLALVHSRLGDERTAVEFYIRSCDQEPSFIHRGNLDPEISALIKKYNLNSEKL